MKRSFCFRLGLLVFLAACQSPTPNATLTPRPVPTTRLTPTPYSVSVVKSSDGKTRAQLICYLGYMQLDCETDFPNGHVLHGAPSDPSNSPSAWSPDNNYTIVCVGANHDSPCAGFEVWDMVNGVVQRTLPYDSPFHQWEPDQPHTLIYLLESHYVGVLDQLIDYDAASATDTNLAACPDLILKTLPQACDNFPGVVIGGELSGLPDDFSVPLFYYSHDQNMLWGWSPQSGTRWATNLRKGFGLSFSVTPMAVGYVSTPVSYTLYLSGTQALITDHGIVTSVSADQLDFHFERLK
jgi:hypothetical protein